jgi:hypothetical protein
MSIGEVKATIREGVQAAREGCATIEQATAQVAEAVAGARSATHDTRDPDVKRCFDELAAATHEADLTIRRFVASIDSANAYIVSVG